MTTFVPAYCPNQLLRSEHLLKRTSFFCVNTIRPEHKKTKIFNKINYEKRLLNL